MRKSFLSVVMMTGVAFSIMGCQTPPKTDEARTKLDENSRSALASMKQTDPGFESFLNKAYGYAVFPTVGKGGLGVGGAYGHGEVFEQGQLVGYTELTQATIGLQAGGQEYTEVVAFETKSALDHFRTGKFTFAAQASAVALKSGASTNAKYTEGVAIFTQARGGLMAEAAVGGQKFGYQPIGSTTPMPSNP